MRVKFVRIKQLTAQLTATLSLFFSILLSKYWRQMFSSGNRARSVWPGGKYRSIRHTKISVAQTGIFGRMERALSVKGVKCALGLYLVTNDGNFRSSKKPRRAPKNPATGTVLSS